MYLQIGNYAFPPYEVGLTISRQCQIVKGIVISYTDRWDFQGRMQVVPTGNFNTDQAAVSVAIAQREQSLLNAINSDITFFFDNGTASAHQILANNTQGGVRLVQPLSYPDGKGAEYSTYRNWTAAIEADYYSSTVAIYDFRETVNFTGDGGPIWKYQLALNGTPYPQTLFQQSTYSAVQSGRAVSLGTYTSPPQPLFPGNEQTWRRQIVMNGPDRVGFPPNGYFKDFEVLWTYFFESVAPLSALPNIYPGP